MAFAKLSVTQKDSFDSILTDAVASKSTPAMFFGVTNAEGPLYIKTVGTKLVDDPASGAIDEDSVFWLCSQTKLITSIAALQLVEQGKITLDTPVETVLPELANPVVVTAHDEAGRPVTTTPAKGKITLGQLLNHTSGLDYALDGTTPTTGATLGMPVAYSRLYKDGEGVSTFFEVLKGSLPGIPLRFEPGTNFAYGFSTDCAGFIVERLSGKSLEQYFQDHIFGPLGLTSSSFYLTPQLKERLLPISYRTKSGPIERWNAPPIVDQDPANVRVHLGGVGLATTSILSRASFDSLFAPSLPPAGAATLDVMAGFFNAHVGLPAGAAQFGRGLMVNTADIPGKRRKGSGAWGGWAGTSFFVDPAAGVAAVVGTQLVPTMDDMHERKYNELERALYGGL
ncbi:beta-lactamase [Mycena olivaceomarginata]|nr:beta-lactamase [Mycena olivaceomarginata]